MKKFLNKNRLLVIVLIVNMVLWIILPQKEASILYFTGKNMINFLFMLTPVFICIGLMDVWIERDMMVNVMGEKAGVRGRITALLMGMVTAVPIYALLPVAGVLLKKDCSIRNVLLFLCASASIRIPLLLFEVSALGWKFTLVRCGLNIIAIVAIASIIDKRLTAEDKKQLYDNAKNAVH